MILAFLRVNQLLKISLLVLFGMFGCSCVFAQDTLTVMSYNIYHGEQAYEEGKGNLGDVAGLIQKVNPDFVALQEVDEKTGRLASLNDDQPFSLVDSLAVLTGMHSYFGKAIDYDGGGYGEGLLSKKPLKPYKKMLPIPKGGEKRAVLYVKTETKSGIPFIFAGTHLCHQYQANREVQARTISHYFADKQHVMIAGDFNFRPNSKPYQIIQKQWMDAAIAAGSYPNMTYSFEDPDRRIDYLFLSNNSNWEVLEVKTIRRNYSDHLPLVAKIVIYPH